ncbi:MAG: aminotransferase class V-fold PLP-dependent enzyme, partial [Polyangiales bacterium]
MKEPPPRTAHRARLGDRSLFPDLEPEAYLSHAAISPASIAVREAVTAVLDDYATKGGTRGFGRWMAQRQRLRATLAELVGADARDIGFVPNTTQGVIDIALCLPWKHGDRVVLFEGEFPANVTPWQRAAELFGLELVFVPLSPFERSHDEGLEQLEAELSRGARLAATSFVQFQTGLRMPVERMAERCHAHGAELFVDAIQGLGAVPLDAGAAGIDYLACGGHKWLMGLEGAGFLYVAPERVRALRPHVAGWLAHEDAFAFLFQGPGHLRYDRPIRRDAGIFEPGAQNVAGYAGLEAAVDLITGLGVERVVEHVSAYLDALEPALV